MQIACDRCHRVMLHSRANALQRHGGMQAAVLRRGSMRYRCGTAQHTTAAVAAGAARTDARLMQWLREHGAPPQRVSIASQEVCGRAIDVTVAGDDLKRGDVALRIPDNLIVTLDRVLGNEQVAELLTTNKLSELAVLTLYMMYEKRRGQNSFWYHYIKALDKQRGMGQQAVTSPLLWPSDDVKTLLAGSPVLNQIEDRRAGIEREYNELDTVWFMSGSLFKGYPYEVPSEEFSLDIFTQAFAAMQACVVHLQGVPLAKRFALVPLGPPLLSYSSTCSAMLQYDGEAKEVKLVVDRDYAAGDRVFAWCGPQPNSRLLINYGIVDDHNPYDKMSITATLQPVNCAFFQQKKLRLQALGMATQATFQLQRGAALPPNLLAFLRIAACPDEASIAQVQAGDDAAPLQGSIEVSVLACLTKHLQQRMAAYKTTIEQDAATIDDPSSPPRAKVASTLLRIEKQILQRALDELAAMPHGGTGNGAAGAGTVPVRLS